MQPQFVNSAPQGLRVAGISLRQSFQAIVNPQACIPVAKPHYPVTEMLSLDNPNTVRITHGTTFEKGEHRRLGNSTLARHLTGDPDYLSFL